MTHTERIQNIYHTLYRAYGPQGWWPLCNAQIKNHSDEKLARGYHPLDYDTPAATDPNSRLEICIGAILTQNTSWTQVEKALSNLHQLNLLTPSTLHDGDMDVLKEAIKPSGYFNQKAKKIKAFCSFFQQLHGATPEREELLNLWGIGPETADSILLYAYQVPVFVIDAYTRRIFSRIFYQAPPQNLQDYHSLQLLFHQSYPKSRTGRENQILFNEYHALLVEHGKAFCKKKPDCTNCPLSDGCDYPGHAQ